MEQDELRRRQEVYFLAKALVDDPEGRTNLTGLQEVWSSQHDLNGVVKFMAALAERVEEFSTGVLTVRRVSVRAVEDKVATPHGAMSYLATCPAGTEGIIKSLDEFPDGATVYMVGPYREGCTELNLG